MGKKLATNFLAFGIKMTPSAVLVLKREKNLCDEQELSKSEILNQIVPSNPSENFIH